MEKMAFITPHGLYCYNVMPLGLKNDRVTYQRLVTEIFRPLLSNTMEAYIDDHIQHLQEVFELLRRYSMKLNPLKCAFGVSSSKFLGFMVIQRGIEANPVQLKAIMDSQASTFKKGVQQLIGRLATLRRFISRFIDPLKPFFITLKGVKRTGLSEECDQAFMAIK